MREQLLAMLGGWAHALTLQPHILIPIAMIGALVYVAIAGGRIGTRLAGIGSLSSGPILIVSGLITLGVCMLWAAIDAVFWALDAPYLSERILWWLAPDGMLEAELRALVAALPEGRLRLPTFVAVPIALFAAGTLHGLITWLLGGALKEMLALEQNPDDAEAKPAPAAAPASSTPAQEETSAPPLADDRFGRIYKRFGHWTKFDRVELRFLRWQIPLVRALLALTVMAFAAVAMRDLPIPVWVGIVVLLTALLRNAKKPPREVAKPVEAKEQPAEPPAGPSKPFTELPELVDRLAPAPSAPAREPRPPTTAPAARALLADVLDAFGVRTLWTHQAAALEAYLDRRSVLLATAPGSGRRTFSDALVLYALLADADRVLYICRDREAAREAAAAFDARARKTHWTWNILSIDLCERAGAVDPELSVPSLVFVDPDTLHRRMLASRDRWSEFLGGLGLIVVPSIDGYSGVPAAHLAHLFRRLDRAISAARMPNDSGALLPDDPTRRVRVFATCAPGFADVGRFAERIAARSFVIIGPERDGAPIPTRTNHIIVPPAAVPHQIRDLARRNGFRGELEGYAGELTADELATSQPLATADVIVSRMSAARYASLPYLTEHLGASTTHPVAVLWQPDREPVAEHLATVRPPLGDARLPAGQSLVAQPRSPALERVHLRASIAESEVSLEQLSAVFSRELLSEELGSLREQSRLVERERVLLDPRAGAFVRVRGVRLASREDAHRGVSFTASATPFELVERSTGAVVADFDGARAPCAAYPRRVFVRGVRRYFVLPLAEQDQLERRRIMSESTATPALTAPIRRLELQLIERRQQRRDQRLGSLLGLGGAGFWLQTREVQVVERVFGARTFDLEGTLREEIHDDPPLRCEYAARATLLVFPDAFGELAPPALHGLVHLIRATLPTALHHDEDDLEITSCQADAGAGVRPALAFVDLHQEGAGFADAITLDLLRPVLLLSRDLLTTSGDRAVVSTSCRAPAAERALDAAGTRSILDTLLRR